MATETISNAAPANIDLNIIYQAGATRSSTSATSVTYTNPSGIRVVINGVGLAFGASGVPTGGLINSLLVFDTTGTVQYVSITGLIPTRIKTDSWGDSQRRRSVHQFLHWESDLGSWGWRRRSRSFARNMRHRNCGGSQPT